MGNGVWGACTPSMPIKRSVMRYGGLSRADEYGMRASCPSLPCSKMAQCGLRLCVSLNSSEL